MGTECEPLKGVDVCQNRTLYVLYNKVEEAKHPRLPETRFTLLITLLINMGTFTSRSWLSWVITSYMSDRLRTREVTDLDRFPMGNSPRKVTRCARMYARMIVILLGLMLDTKVSVYSAKVPALLCLP